MPVQGPVFSSDQPAPRAVGIIPARWGATRFPGKLLADLAGTPVICHTYRRAAASTLLKQVLVATDDQRIMDAITKVGGKAVMTDSDLPSGTDRVASVAAKLRCDVVVNIQGDEPLIAPENIDRLVAAFVDPDVEIATMMTPLRSREDLADPNAVKVVCDARGDALYFSRHPIPFSRDHKVDLGHGPGLGWKHLGIYAYRRKTLLALARLRPSPLERAESLEQLRFLEAGYGIRVIQTAEETVGIDTPDDLDKVRSLISKE